MPAADFELLGESGGKFIAYHGWSDTGPNPTRMAWLFDDLLERKDAKTLGETARLFMVPGMFHCGGGSNVDKIDAMTPLINWVENGVPPDQMIARRVENGELVRSRPICVYPNVARYKGQGSTDEAENFACVSPD